MLPGHDYSMMDHLEELRKRVLVSLVWVTLFSVVAFYFSDVMINWMTRPIQGSIRSLYFLTPYEAFLTKLKLSVISGAVLALPVILMQIWKCISPGLSLKEQKGIVPFVVLATGLFISGVLFAYFLVIPFALNFFLGFRSDSLQPMISIGSYVSFFTSILVSFGIVFDIPIMVLGLIYLGVLQSAYLAEQRKYIILVSFILAAVLTPTVDMVTQCLLAVPLWLLFEISILIGRVIERKKQERNQ